MSTALIIRPVESPEIRVLEVDGPRQKYTQRGEGSYYLLTDNHPEIESSFYHAAPPYDPRLKDWDSPHWEIIQHLDGSIAINACRPTIQEAMRGDLFGRWGSTIHLGKQPTRFQVRLALQIARRLCKCNPMEDIRVSVDLGLFIGPIVTDIPIVLESRIQRSNTGRSAA